MRMRVKYRKKAFAAIIALALMTAILFSAYALGGKAKGAICIDAGHGGEDVGAVYNGRYEKDDNLQMAQEVSRVLSQQGQKVLMTRSEDKTVSLNSRSKLANARDAALFVSIHRNSGAGGSGVEIWVEHTAPERDTALADFILNQLEPIGINANRGIKYGIIDDESKDYHVNRETEMPSCLVELGFMDSEADNALFDQNLKPYAKAIAMGIMAELGISFQENLYTES